MTSIRWISKPIILSVHAAQLSEHGGINGIRDEGLLDSALGRPAAKAACGDQNLSLLAAAYAFGIAKNHPFLDGNKRTAYVAMELFLTKNGLALTATDEDAVLTFLRLAAGEFSEQELALWIQDHLLTVKP